MIRFGAPVFPDFDALGRDPEAYTAAHERKGYRAAYLPSGLRPEDTVTIQALRDSMRKRDIMIAELGIYNNMLDTDPATRTSCRQDVLQGFAVAEAAGARCFTCILGTFAHGRCRDAHVAANLTDEAFDAAVELARYFIDEIKPKCSFFTFESFPFNVIDSPESIARLVSAVDRKHFGVHLDLVNLVNSPRTYFTSGALMRECIKLFGDRIVSAHAKDIRAILPSISVMFEEVIPGKGNIDMTTYLDELQRLPAQIPLMMEHLENEADYDSGTAYIRGTARQCGFLL